ncbi:MAG: asparaginase [Bacilli bacterium]
MKNILLITTGGTIASKPTIDGFMPKINSKELLSYLDDLSNVCNIDTIELFNFDSTNINYVHWLKMVETIKENYDKYDGFVITHGTDTMAFTASALSYLIQNSIKPIVLTGSQKSIFMKDSDARSNLFDAFIYASHPTGHGVTIVFDGKVILGTRAKKNRTKSYNAFTSINYPAIANIQDGKVIEYIEVNVDVNKGVKFYDSMNPKVFVLKLIPGMSLDIFDYVSEHYDACIIESFGVGGIPMYDEQQFSDALERFILSNKTLVITTQVPYEGSNLGLYKVGKKIKDKYEVLEAYDMTLESLVCKVMWVLGQTNDKNLIKKLLYTKINNDINL